MRQNTYLTTELCLLPSPVSQRLMPILVLMVDDATPDPERLRHVPKILVAPEEGGRSRLVVQVTRGGHGC